MGKQPFVSHAVNGYSRYDVPESKAFSCTPGILYPVRIDFINARDRVTISQGIDVRSNPLAVPSFNPYTVRLHRFWVPLQLYHPEMRTNSSNFDMNNLSWNWLPTSVGPNSSALFNGGTSAFSNSLFNWLRICNHEYGNGESPSYVKVDQTNSVASNEFLYANADSYLAYWDIVRNYYAYSQWSIYSFAWPATWRVAYSNPEYSFVYPGASTSARFFSQRVGSVEYLDAYFESQFYPSAVDSSNGTYNRINLAYQIVRSDISSLPASSITPLSDTSQSETVVPSTSAVSTGFPVAPLSDGSAKLTKSPTSQFENVEPSPSASSSLYTVILKAHPMAVVPSNPDRFSRLIPNGTSSDVSMSGVTTIPQLAIASRLQEYKDLLGVGGSRYSDWLETFFASRIEHVDRPRLLFSASQTVNVQVVMNTAGVNNFGNSGEPLGQQGGAIAFNAQLGRRQSYYFREPGYMIDMLSIRPVYYWSGVRPDYLDYKGPDYFNPIYNDIGYQSVPAARLGYFGSAASAFTVVANEPCFNEFRSSYDEALGQLQTTAGLVSTSGTQVPLYSYWVQQRSAKVGVIGVSTQMNYYPYLFVDMESANSPFSSNVEDNFFVNLAYSVYKKNLVNKTFATRLSNR